MKKQPQPLRQLLDDTLPSPDTVAGPSLPELVAMVRRHRARRRCMRGLGAAALLVGAIFGLVRLVDGPAGRTMAAVGQEDPATASTAAARGGVVVERVTDEQLLALLEDTPAALLKWPNGKRTLLLVAPKAPAY